MAKTKRIIRKTDPVAEKQFDEQNWPVNIALILLTAFVVGLLAARWYNQFWVWWAVAGVITLAGGLMLALRFVSNRVFQRTTQLAIVVSLLVHLVFVVGTNGISIFGKWNDNEKTVAELPQPVEHVVPEYRPNQINPEQRQQQDFLQPVETETPEPTPKPDEVKQQPTEKEVQPPKPPKPQPIPTPQVEPTPTPNITRRETPSETTPRQSESPSKLSRQTTERAPQTSQSTEAVANSQAQRNPSPQKVQAQATETSKQSTESKVAAQRSQTEPVPTTSKPSETAQIQRRTSDAAPTVETAASPTAIDRSTPDRMVTPKTVAAAEAPSAPTQQTDPTTPKIDSVAATRQSTASPTVTPSQVEPTPQTTVKVESKVQKRQNEAPIEPTVAQATSTPTQRRTRSTNRPSVTETADATPSQSPTESPRQPSASPTATSVTRSNNSASAAQPKLDSAVPSPTPTTQPRATQTAQRQSNDSPTMTPSPTAAATLTRTRPSPSTQPTVTSAATPVAANTGKAAADAISATSTAVGKQSPTSAPTAAASPAEVASASPTAQPTTATQATRRPRSDRPTEVATAANSAPSRSQSTAKTPTTNSSVPDAVATTNPSPAQSGQPGPATASVSRQQTNSPSASRSQTPSAEPTSSATNQLARAANPRATKSSVPTLDATAAATNSPNRAQRASVQPVSPTNAASPAVTASNQATGSASLQAARVALNKGVAGTAGVGSTSNLDRALPAPSAPSLVASGSAKRAEPTRRDAPSNDFAPSENSRVGRSAAAAPTPQSSNIATLTDSGAAQTDGDPSELTASASAAATRSSSNAAEGAVSADAGSVSVDTGPTRLVSEGGVGRAGGGGQPDISAAADSNATPRAETGSRPEMSIAATVVEDSPAAPQGDGGGQPSTPESSPEATTLVRTETGGGEPASGGPALADAQGPPAESNTADVGPTAVARAEQSEAAPGEMGGEGGEPFDEEDEEERKRRLALARANAGGGPSLGGPEIAELPTAPANTPAGGAPTVAVADAGPSAEVSEKTAAGGSPTAATTASASVTGPAMDASGGEQVAQAQVGRAELSQTPDGSPTIGGGSASPSRTSSGPTLAMNTRAENVALSGGPSSGAPKGVMVAAQGTNTTKVAGGSAGEVTQLAAGAPSSSANIDSATSLAVGPAEGGRATTATAGDAGKPTVGQPTSSGPGRTSTQVAFAGPSGVNEPVDIPGPSGRSGEPNTDFTELAGGGEVGPLSRSAPGGLVADVAAVEGPGGLGSEYSVDAGISSRRASRNETVVAMAPNSRFPRKDAGGDLSFSTTVTYSTKAFDRTPTGTGGPTGGSGSLPPENEEAIELGLAFLQKYQSADGSWSLHNFGAGEPDFENERPALVSDTAATGLSLMAFLGAGFTHVDYQYKGNVGRGLQFLIDNQKKDGDLYVQIEGGGSNAVWLYSHSIAAIALCEAYGMTQDPKLREPAQKAIDFIVSSQHPDRGGWRYSPRFGSDTSVTGWMMMALYSGRHADLDVPPETFEKIEDWLDLAQAPDEPYLYRYNPYAPDTVEQRHGRQASKPITSVGLLMRLYIDWKRDDPNMKKGADYLMQSLPKLIGDRNQNERDTYYWYYGTQIMLHMGGEYWEKWNAKLRPLLVETQQKRGAFAGSWDPRKPVPDRWGPHAGRLYVTTMNLLSLEVKNRRLPIYEDLVDE